MRDVQKNKDQAIWVTALQTKFTPAELDPLPVLDAEYFDKVLGTYAGVADIPSAVFAEELLAAYPDAKVILTTREEDGWMESMKSTIWHAWYQRHIEGPPRAPENIMDMVCLHLWKGDFPTHGRQWYREHNELVRRLAPKRAGQFLDYEARQGWGPLCEFLGVEVPEIDFPRNDAWARYKIDGSFEDLIKEQEKRAR